MASRVGARSAAVRGVVAALVLACGCVTDAGRLGMPASATGAELAEAIRLGDMALDHWIERDARVQRITQELRAAGAPLCEGELSAVLGLALVSSADVPAAHRPAAERRYSDRRLRVARVFAGMPAARAGVAPGDVVLSIDGERVLRDYDAYRVGSGSAREVALALERGGERLEIEVERLPGCAYAAKLFLGDTVGAFAATELRYTLFFSALVRELRDDADLAFIVGHELGHNIIRRLRLAVPSDPVEGEALADYLGAYLAARAGYGVEGRAGAIFAVLLRGDASAAGVGGVTHPVASARVLALERTMDEIREKRGRGVPLLPEVD